MDDIFETVEALSGLLYSIKSDERTLRQYKLDSAAALLYDARLIVEDALSSAQDVANQVAERETELANTEYRKSIL